MDIPVKKTLALALTALPIVVAGGRPRPRGGAQESTGAVEHVGTIYHGPLEEVSGIVKSTRYDDVYWVHNDGGHEARLYPIDGAGKVIVAESAEGTPGPGNSSPPDGSCPADDGAYSEVFVVPETGDRSVPVLSRNGRSSGIGWGKGLAVCRVPARVDIARVVVGGPHGTRTHDLRVANAALSQLS